MQLIDWLFGLAIMALAVLTGCGNHRLYIGVEDYDTVQEHRETKQLGIWERIAGGGNAQLSGSN